MAEVPGDSLCAGGGEARARDVRADLGRARPVGERRHRWLAGRSRALRDEHEDLEVGAGRGGRGPAHGDGGGQPRQGDRQRSALIRARENRRPEEVLGIAQLYGIFVDPPFWKRGVGRMLFEAAVGRAKELKAGALMIHAEPSAEGFYKRMGAIRIGEGPFYYSPELILLYIVPR